MATALSDSPETLSIYRGEAEGSTPYHKAFSWSMNINAAFFFACRHGDKDHARIIRAKVRKRDVMGVNLDCVLIGFPMCEFYDSPYHHSPFLRLW